MAGRVRVGKKKKNHPSGFFSGISSAFSELVLIILLFADGLFQYAAKKFARYCKLPLPCPLCTQLDGVLGDPKPVSFGDSLCEVHKSEISSLALCSSHRRLADARSKCDACSLVSDFLQKLPGENNNINGATKSPSPPLPLRCCACCFVPFKDRSLAARKLIQAQKPTTGVDDVLEPLLPLSEKPPSRELTVYQDGTGKVKKITSYSPDHSDDGAATADLKGECVSRDLHTTPKIDLSENTTRGISDDVDSEKLALPSPAIPDQAPLTAVERNHEIGASGSGAGSDVCGSDEMNRSQVENPHCPSSEVTSEQLPSKAHAREVDVANGDARKTFGSIDINFKTSQIMNAKLAPGTRPSLPFSASSDLIAERESYRVPEDLKVRLSQISSNRWPEFPGNDATSNPQVSGQGDEPPRLSDASSSNGILNHIKRYHVDRYESGLDSLDGSLVGDVEGESTVEMDIKSLRILYKELEEERNASAIAANQAMAMINRLQEEKAAMQMEASQYLRMMEEQSEYDQEALQKLNDLLVDREMEIQDLEAEIDGYRKQFRSEPLGDCEEREYREYTPVSTPGFMKYRSHEIESNLEKNTIADFEDEKIYISECLKRLQKRLQIFSNGKLSFGGSELDAKEDGFLDKSSLLEENDTRNCEYVKHPSADNDQEISQWNGTPKNNQKMESMISDVSPSKEDSSIIKFFTPSSPQDLEFSIEETLKESNEKQFQMVSRRNDITALGKEIAQLNARLEALEVDKSFLDHAVDLLKNGCDGLQFIQEIASHLRELRKIGINIHQEQIINA